MGLLRYRAWLTNGPFVLLVLTVVYFLNNGAVLPHTEWNDRPEVLRRDLIADVSNSTLGVCLQCALVRLTLTVGTKVPKNLCHRSQVTNGSPGLYVPRGSTHWY